MSTSSPVVSDKTDIGLAGPKNPGTQRQDVWQTEAVLTVLVIVFFAIYVTWRALQGFADYNHNFLTEHHHDYLANLGYLYTGGGAHYVSPFAAPDLSPVLQPFITPVADFLRKITGWSWLVLSPAMWLLWAPGGFRLTCYFYRRAYYRSFFNSPAACAVNTQFIPTAPVLTSCAIGKGAGYRGERGFPMVLVNLHRYFFYVAAIFIVLHAIDTVVAFFFQVPVLNATGQVVGYKHQLGVGVGTIMILLDTVFLALYTFSCHSFRHLLGGMLDSFSKWGAIGQLRHSAWLQQTKINEHHMFFAWLSMGWVLLVDFYIWQLALGHVQDFKILLPFSF